MKSNVYRNPENGKFASQRTWLENVIKELWSEAKDALGRKQINLAKAILEDRKFYVAELAKLD